MHVIYIIACTLAGVMVYASFAEWLLHYRVMHHSLWGFDYPYKAHALTHHKIFQADGSYHLANHPELKQEYNKEKIRMAWWNGAALVVLGTLPIVAVSLPFALHYGYWAEVVLMWAISTATFAGYYGAYEYLHWCMHLPKARRVEMWWVFRRLNAHHILHHRYWLKNLNVVFPLADFVLGSLVVRAKKPFMQVRGPGIPDLQPA